MPVTPQISLIMPEIVIADDPTPAQSSVITSSQ
jgi:hypothetical protein